MSFYELVEIGKDEGKGGDTSSCHELQENGSRWESSCEPPKRDEIMERGAAHIVHAPRINSFDNNIDFNIASYLAIAVENLVIAVAEAVATSPIVREMLTSACALKLY